MPDKDAYRVDVMDDVHEESVEQDTGAQSYYLVTQQQANWAQCDPHQFAACRTGSECSAPSARANPQTACGQFPSYPDYR